MDRRTDRAIAISALTAVVLVPTAALAFVNTGMAEPKRPGDAPTPASLSQQTPLAERADRLPAKPLSSPQATQKPGGGKQDGAKPGKPATKAVRGYTRVTDVKLSGAANGDYQQATETAKITLSPRFALHATGVRRVMASGKLTTLTQKVVVSGRTMRTFDGGRWTSTPLSAATYQQLRTGSDPRLFTHLIRSAPGGTKTGPDRLGSTKYAAATQLGTVYSLLPPDLVAEARKVLPDSTSVSVTLWANREDRPSLATLNAATNGASLNGSMTFRDFR